MRDFQSPKNHGSAPASGGTTASAGVMSDVPIGVDRHNGQEPEHRQLLALHGLRGGLERLPQADNALRDPSMALASGLTRP